MEAINWAIQYNKKRITIYYDYEGIEKWASGQWRVTKRITKKYICFINDKKNKLNIEFIKVPAHAGIHLNEEVDALAKNALLVKGHRTYNDGSVYFVGYSIQDWKKIIKRINDENANFSGENVISPIVFNTENQGNKEKIKITQGNNTVVINCYNQIQSYVQGKQSVLFSKIITTAIELLNNKTTVIETLNNYHALTLKPDDVENQFSQLLPHYKNVSEKHYSNLLSAVYNTMLTGYMPDYTCLVTPIFRAYEYYLHRILKDKMSLDTEKNNGTNNFAFFSRNLDGFYECNNSNKRLLSTSQLNYLNTLYTKYNSVRHPYSHWSASDIDVAVIPDISTAREILLDGLTLIDKYYVLF